MSEFEMIDVSIDTRGVARLTLDRPEAKNAMSQPLMRELRTAARQLAEDESVRVIVLTGAGEVFSAGGDLKGMTQQAGQHARRPHRRRHRVRHDPRGARPSGQTADRANQRLGVRGRLGVDLDLRHCHWPGRLDVPPERSHARSDPGHDFALRRGEDRRAQRAADHAQRLQARRQRAARLGLLDVVVRTIEELDEAVEREVAAALHVRPAPSPMPRS